MRTVLFIVLIVGLAGALCADDAKPAGETLLAEKLDGWVEEQHDFFKKKHPDTTTWSIKDGVTHCDGSQGNCGFLRYEKALCDFRLTLEYKVAKGCNSGIGFRAAIPYTTLNPNTLPSNVGYEFQIMDDAGKPADKTGSGALYNRIAPIENAAKTAGEWNTLELECRGQRFTAKLNGKTVQNVDLSMIEGSKHPTCGFLSLQNHGGDAEFRAIRLIEIHDEAADAKTK
ncbi:MAG: DUF1080 domain-containing protein [Pirellulales bacterium]